MKKPALATITLRPVPLFVFACVFLSPSAARGGAWVREAGEAYLKASASRFASDEIFEAKGGGTVPGPDFRDDTLDLYGEYGFSPRWTGVASVMAKMLSSGGRDRTGVSDAWFYAKRLLKTDPVVLSAQAGVKVPLGYSGRPIPPLGEGQIDFEGRVLAGKSLYPRPFYASAEAGYRKRNGDFSDEIVYLAETGVFLGRSALVKLVYDVVESRSNDTASKAPNRHPNVFDKEYTQLSAGVAWFRPGGFGVEVFYRTLLTGGNAAKGDTIGVSAFWQGFLRR